MSLPDRARAAILAALVLVVRAGELEAEARGGVETERWVVERPKRQDHGDLATNGHGPREARGQAAQSHRREPRH